MPHSHKESVCTRRNLSPLVGAMGPRGPELCCGPSVASRLLADHTREVPNVVHNFCRTILELFWNYFGLSELCWNYFGTILELLGVEQFQKSSKIVPKKFRLKSDLCSSGTYLELFWNYFGTFLELFDPQKFKKSSKIVPKKFQRQTSQNHSNPGGRPISSNCSADTTWANRVGSASQADTSWGQGLCSSSCNLTPKLSISLPAESSRTPWGYPMDSQVAQETRCESWLPSRLDSELFYLMLDPIHLQHRTCERTLPQGSGTIHLFCRTIKNKLLTIGGTFWGLWRFIFF